MIQSLEQYRHIYLIGIGGSGVSGLARILKSSGTEICGSDEKSSPLTDELSSEGVRIIIGHSSKNLPPETDLVIYSPAVPANNPERLEAKVRKISQLSYPQAVGILTANHISVCVCGTHGKTTTTGLAAAAFIVSDKDPLVLLGSSTCELDNRNSRYGKGKYFVLESCEHFRSFLNYNPAHVIITNIEPDHLDYYKDLDDYKSAFKEFIAKLPENGLLIANGDDPSVLDIIKDIKKINVFLYGQNGNNQYQIKGQDLYYKGKKIFRFDLKIPGLHNIYNAAAVFALCHELRFDMHGAAGAINNYAGAARRFEIKGRVGDTTVIDDYAHHPTEIAATLKSLRQKYGPDKKILCVFQPHQYSRTKHLLEGFIGAFPDADAVIIPDILRVRDTDEELKNIDPETFVKRISDKHASVRFGGGLKKTIATIRRDMKNYDVVITMGAGDVWKIADALVENV